MGDILGRRRILGLPIWDDRATLSLPLNVPFTVHQRGAT